MSARYNSDSPSSSKRLRVFRSGVVLLGFAVLGSTVSTLAQQSMVVEPVKASISMLDSTREQDGLLGPVRRVHTEMSKLLVNAGTVVEEARMLLEITTYDPQGKRIWNVYYPVNSDSFKGNQEFTYDEQGHVKEMTLRDDTGRILSREAYSYEYDSFGNWTKMTSSLVIFEGGKIVQEPFELTSRAISYYFDDAVAKIVQPPAPSTDKPTTVPSVAANISPALTANKTSSDIEKETIKPPVGADAKQSTALPEKTVLPDPAGLEKAQTKEDPVKRDVEVTAGSGVQAYQIPAVPSPAPATTKPTVSGGVISGRILNLPKPIYPTIARSRGVIGRVVVEVTLDEKGQVVDARALSGNPILKVSALTAARMARFEPTLLSGQPVKATRLINFDFNGR